MQPKWKAKMASSKNGGASKNAIFFPGSFKQVLKQVAKKDVIFF